MTDEFIVSMRAKSRIKLSEDLEFRSQDGDRHGKIKCLNWERTESDGRETTHLGLIVQAQVEASGLDDAISFALRAAETALLSLSVQTLAACAPAQVDIAFDASPGKSVREFRQFMDLPLAGSSVKVAAAGLAVDIAQRVGDMDEMSRQERLVRASWCLRRGMGMVDPLGRFNYYWSGLESLNRILKERLDSEQRVAKCAKCGAETKVDEATGVRDFLDQVIGKGDRAKLRTLRRDVVHGIGDFLRVESECVDLFPVLEQALRKGILLCLGYSLDEMKDIPVMRAEVGPKSVIYAELFGEDPLALGPEDGIMPHFVVSHDMVSAKKEAGTTTIQTTHSYEPRMRCEGRIIRIATLVPPGIKVFDGDDA